MIRQKQALIQIVIGTIILLFTVSFNRTISKELTLEEKTKIKKTQDQQVLKMVNKFNGYSTPKLKDVIFNGKLLDKGWAARALIRRKDISLNEKIEIIKLALKKEISTPTSKEFLIGAYAPISEMIKSQYTFSLEDLGKDAIPELKKIRSKAKSKDELTQRITIALGYLEDKNVDNDLINLSLNTQNGYIRAEAIKALYKGGLLNSSMIPKLTKSLKDPFFIIIKSDMVQPKGFEWRNIYYPVRGASFAALTKLGVKIKRNKWDFYVIK